MSDIRVEHGSHIYRVVLFRLLPPLIERLRPNGPGFGPQIKGTSRLGRALVKKAASALLREQLAASVAAGEKA